MNAKVSIVVTCFDLGAYLQEALDSVPMALPQGSVEVVVVDDGSTDPLTRRVIDGLDRSRYTVLVQANAGLGNARNKGIARSSGEYIIPLDADNRLNEEGLRAAVDLLDRDPDVEIAYGDAMYFGAREGPWKVAGYDFSRLLRKNYIDACACFRRSVWERLNGYDEQMPRMGWEDWDLWLRASVQGMRFQHIGGTFFDYRVREGSMIGDSNRHADVLTAYIFNKPALRHLGVLRTEYLQLRADHMQYLGVTGALRLAWARLLQK